MAFLAFGAEMDVDQSAAFFDTACGGELVFEFGDPADFLDEIGVFHLACIAFDHAGFLAAFALEA